MTTNFPILPLLNVAELHAHQLRKSMTTEIPLLPSQHFERLQSIRMKKMRRRKRRRVKLLSK